MTKVAYIRVSTGEQNLDAQRDALKALDIEKVYEEKASGMDAARPVLAQCLDFMREGDTLYVTRADRLGRSTEHLLGIVRKLREKGVELHFIEQPELSTDTSQGELMLTLLAGVAKFETRLRAERCREGIAAAKAKGVKFGRPGVSDEDRIAVLSLHAEEVRAVEIAKRTGLHVSTVYRLIGV